MKKVISKFLNNKSKESSATDETSLLQFIPQELIPSILQFIPKENLLYIRMTCKKWNEIIEKIFQKKILIHFDVK